MSPTLPHGPLRASLVALGVSLAVALDATAVRAAGLEGWIQSFAESEFQFARARSNVPFPPAAWLTASTYGTTELAAPSPGASGGEFDQDTLSQGALVPFMVGTRDIVAVGEWISTSRFEPDTAGREGFSAFSFAVPVGWARQWNDAWQVAAFVAPLGHKADTRGSEWAWETMGGVFGRWRQRDDLAWIFGFYADVSKTDELYLPYVGATWTIDERWTLSVVLPWPSLFYAPTPDTFFRLGASPSGASWTQRQAGRDDIELNLDAFNLGVSAEHRVWKNLWLRGEAGVSGFRGLRASSGGDVEEPGTPLGTAPYVLIGVNFRPSLAP